MSNSNRSIDLDKELKGMNSAEKLSKMSTSKYTPADPNKDFDTDVLDLWYEIRTKFNPARRSFHCCWNFKDYIYIYGGVNINIGKCSDFHKINLVTETPAWKRFVPINVEMVPPLAYASYLTIDDEFYIIFGQNDKMNQVNTIFKIIPSSNEEEDTYDEKEDIYFTKDKIEKVLINDLPYLESHSTAIYNNGFYVFGGFGKGKYSNNLYFIDLKNNTCNLVEIKSDKNKMPEPRMNSSLTSYLDKLYVFGGQNEESKYLNDFWIFDIKSSTWEKLSFDSYKDIPNERSGHSSVLYNNEIYIFGGKTNPVIEVNDMWKFNPSTNKFMLVQEYLLEQYEYLGNVSQSEDQKSTIKKKHQSLRLSKIPTNKLLTESSMKKKKKNVDSSNQIYEEALEKSFPQIVQMKKSLIFSMDIDSHLWRKLNLSLEHNFSMNNRVSVQGSIPCPRDGHSSILYKGFLVIFGGDRNKFPNNDLFTFVLS